VLIRQTDDREPFGDLQNITKVKIHILFVWLISHQPAVLFLSEQISHQQPANSTFPSQQISTSHQPNEQAVNCKLKALFFKFKG
jgi:hypothetical protein